jgi:FkbH-like protein
MNTTQLRSTPKIKSSEFALDRAQWQPILFNTPNRADLAACVPGWTCQTVRVRVHRNHGFEAVSSGTAAFAAWNGLALDWAIGGYDDSLSFDLRGDADVDVIWLDCGRLQGLAGDELAKWIVARLSALRSITDNPVLALVWPLAAAERELVAQAAIASTHLPDLEPLAGELGIGWLDPRTESLSGTRFSNQACLRVARELACRWLPAVAVPPLKAIAVDLDGTLYRGVLGDDGPTHVELTPGHRSLQGHLAKLRQEGVLLALVSRNDRRDVDDLFALRADFPLRLVDFSAIEVSWGDKAAALGRVAAALRIGLDAMVFVDDNPGELAAAAASSPVFTVHARPNGSETEAALAHVAGLFRWQESDEDRLRADDLHAAETRDTLARVAVSQEDYLQSLQIRLGYFVGMREHLPRMAELICRTNQFNLTLRRMNEAEIARRIEERPSNVVAIRLADRLSDSGVVGVLVGSLEEDALRIEEICVSCRALGRRLEDSMLTRALLLLAGDEPPRRVVFDVRKGPRNVPARQWLAQYAKAELTDDIACVDMSYEAIAAKPISTVIRAEVLR